MNTSIKIYKIISVCALILFFSIGLQAQAPDWEYSGDFPITMSTIYAVSDECVPSADPDDLVAAFDINGEVRGVAQANIGNEAYLTIGANTNGETIYFKVYDASSNAIYNIHAYTVSFSSGARFDPNILNFDSNPSNTSGGADQWVVDETSTNLAATGVGTWALIEGADGNIVDPSSPTSLFTGSIGNSYLLAWTFTDTEGCIGETDEVTITFAFAESEDTPERCADGVDNDGNGLTDCQEAACGKPTINSISKIDPTPLTCSTEMSDGSIVINSTAANSFSITNGESSQVGSSFGGLPVGDYSILITNDFAGCTATEQVTLINTLNAAPPVAAFEIDGPAKICSGNDGVTYSLDKPLNGSVTWSYTGNDATINSSGVQGTMDFGENASAGMLKAVMSNACTSNEATMEVGIANSFLCSTFSNCIPMVTVSNSLLENANISHVFQASDQLTSSAQLISHDYEFTAGNLLEFDSGFSVEQGLSFTADIRTCSN